MKIVYMDRPSKLYKCNDEYIQNHMYIERLKNFGLGYFDKTFYYDSYPSSPFIQTSTSVSSPNSTCDSNSNSSNHQNQNGPSICAGCSGILKEKFIYSMNNQFWHSQCLRCETCSIILEQNPSCYMKDKKIYCKKCYDRLVLIFFFY